MSSGAGASIGSAIPPRLLLVVSRALQALATPIVALLISTAAALGADAEDAISFCNVLFIGNLCASGVVIVSFGPRRITRDLRRIAGDAWIEVLTFGALSALLSGLIFYALRTTSVTNAVLLARLGPVFFALGSSFALGERLRREEWMGFGLIGAGVAATVFTGSGFQLVQGDLLILISTLVYAGVQMLGKRLVPRAKLPATVFVRNFLSSAIFFVIANVLFGPQHFADAFYGPLWAIMMVYALVVIVAAQFAWYRSVELLPAASVARWTVLTPVIAIGYALAINGERPDAAQLAGLAFVTLGLVVSNLGRRAPETSPDPESSLAGS